MVLRLARRRAVDEPPDDADEREEPPGRGRLDRTAPSPGSWAIRTAANERERGDEGGVGERAARGSGVHSDRGGGRPRERPRNGSRGGPLAAGSRTSSPDALA